LNIDPLLESNSHAGARFDGALFAFRGGGVKLFWFDGQGM
jgi:hypothetical protein